LTLPAESAAVVSSLDPGVRRAVLQELITDGHIVASGIDATVRGGIVELDGSVAVLSWRQRAARVASVVRGVRAVVNRIRVVPVRKPDTVVQRGVLQNRSTGSQLPQRCGADLVRGSIAAGRRA
jgi:hypothetical protein